MLTDIVKSLLTKSHILISKSGSSRLKCYENVVRMQSTLEQMKVLNAVVFTITTRMRVNCSLVRLSWGGSVILELVNKRGHGW